MKLHTLLTVIVVVCSFAICRQLLIAKSKRIRNVWAAVLTALLIAYYALFGIPLWAATAMALGGTVLIMMLPILFSKIHRGFPKFSEPV